MYFNETSDFKGPIVRTIEPPFYEGENCVSVISFQDVTNRLHCQRYIIHSRKHIAHSSMHAYIMCRYRSWRIGYVKVPVLDAECRFSPRSPSHDVTCPVGEQKLRAYLLHNADAIKQHVEENLQGPDTVRVAHPNSLDTLHIMAQFYALKYFESQKDGESR